MQRSGQEMEDIHHCSNQKAQGGPPHSKARGGRRVRDHTESSGLMSSNLDFNLRSTEIYQSFGKHFNRVLYLKHMMQSVKIEPE